jgi:S2P endopeptidase
MVGFDTFFLPLFGNGYLE